MAVAEGFEPYSATPGTCEHRHELLKYITIVQSSYV